MLLVVLVNGILKLQSGVSLDFDLTETGEAESTITQSYAEKGTAILKERLSGAFEKCGDGRAGSEYRHLVHTER